MAGRPLHKETLERLANEWDRWVGKKTAGRFSLYAKVVRDSSGAERDAIYAVEKLGAAEEKIIVILDHQIG